MLFLSRELNTIVMALWFFLPTARAFTEVSVENSLVAPVPGRMTVVEDGKIKLLYFYTDESGRPLDPKTLSLEEKIAIQKRGRPEAESQVGRQMGLMLAHLMGQLKGPFEAWSVNSAVKQVRERIEVIQKDYFGSKQSVESESDAFRHFLMACMFVERFGLDEAEVMVNIHEVDDVTMNSLVDLYNNEVSLGVCEEMAQQGRLSEQDIIDRAIEMIRQGQLVVQRPQYEYIGGRVDFNDVIINTGSEDFVSWAHNRLRFPLY